MSFEHRTLWVLQHLGFRLCLRGFVLASHSPARPAFRIPCMTGEISLVQELDASRLAVEVLPGDD